MDFRYLLCVLALGAGVGSGGAEAATIVNGGLTGPVGTGVVPFGWTILLGSADTNDVANNVGGGTPFNIPPAGPSPAGGTWVGLARSTGGAGEQFGQVVTGFLPGVDHTLTWLAGNFGALTGPGYTVTNSISVYVDGFLAGSAPGIAPGPNWVGQSITFTPTAPSHLIAFGLTSEVNSYLSIDGIAVSPATPPVPLPAGGWLLVSAVAGIGLVRKRRAA